MAIEARHVRVAGVQLVRERDRLLGRVALMNADARERATDQPCGRCGDNGCDEEDARAHGRVSSPLLRAV